MDIGSLVLSRWGVRASEVSRALRQLLNGLETESLKGKTRYHSRWLTLSSKEHATKAQLWRVQVNKKRFTFVRSSDSRLWTRLAVMIKAASNPEPESSGPERPYISSPRDASKSYPSTADRKTSPLTKWNELSAKSKAIKQRVQSPFGTRDHQLFLRYGR